MRASSSDPKSSFDEYASQYDAALARGISASGETKEFFAQRRVSWLAECLRKLKHCPNAVLDFGCGIGSNTPYLLSLDGVESVLGVDISNQSLEIARKVNKTDRAEFLALNQYRPSEEKDLIFTNGVFHHIPLEHRAGAIDYIYRSLRPGGLFAFWENNPWNPAMRYAMSRIPFDRDAIVLSSREAQRLAKAGGMEVLRTDFLFIFPRALRRLRWIEPYVAGLPIGAQYQVLCRKPLAALNTRQL